MDVRVACGLGNVPSNGHRVTRPPFCSAINTWGSAPRLRYGSLPASEETRGLNHHPYPITPSPHHPIAILNGHIPVVKRARVSDRPAVSGPHRSLGVKRQDEVDTKTRAPWRGATHGGRAGHAVSQRAE